MLHLALRKNDMRVFDLVMSFWESNAGRKQELDINSRCNRSGKIINLSKIVVYSLLFFF